MFILTNQRMVWTRQTGSVTLWAWIVSITVHLIVLTAFVVVKFSQSEIQSEKWLMPTAKVNRIKKLIQADPVIPKPKIKKPLPVTDKGQFSKTITKLQSANQIFGSATRDVQSQNDLPRPSTSQNTFALPSSGISPHRIEFFGSQTDQRKVCYLVDCSGSMRGVFARVRGQLKDSIESLQPDQYFYIIFFGGDRLFESGGGKLLRATQKAKSAAYDFIDSIQPSGQTNAPAALERAVQIRDTGGAAPSTIYFLTDGFELTTEDAEAFPQKIANLLKRFAPTTKINTIGFWPASDDRKMLQTIARQSGGEFVIISDSYIRKGSG